MLKIMSRKSFIDIVPKYSWLSDINGLSGIKTPRRRSSVAMGEWKYKLSIRLMICCRRRVVIRAHKFIYRWDESSFLCFIYCHININVLIYGEYLLVNLHWLSTAKWLWFWKLHCITKHVVTIFELVCYWLILS